METRTVKLTISCSDFTEARYFSIRAKEDADDVLKLVDKVNAEESSAEDLVEHLRNLDFEGCCDLNSIIGVTDDEVDLSISVQDRDDNILFDDEVECWELHKHKFFDESDDEDDNTVDILKEMPQNMDKFSKELLEFIQKDSCGDGYGDDDTRMQFLGVGSASEVEERTWWCNVMQGWGTMSYEIELPADEDFDINKLEVMCGSSICDEDFFQPLNSIIYDGKFYTGYCGEGEFYGNEYYVWKPKEGRCRIVVSI